MNEVPTALLTGATSQVGLHLLPELQVAGFCTLALSRRVPANETPLRAEPGGVHWFAPGPLRQWLERLRQDSPANLPTPDILVSAGPITFALDWLERCKGIKQIVCLSTTSIFTKADSSSETERQQIAIILQAENHLTELCAERGIGLRIFRPTLIYGCGMDENISRMAAFIRKFGFLPVAGRAAGLRQPIHVADLAGLMARAIQSEFKDQRAFNVAGGSTISYREMAASVFRALGKPERLVSLPPALLGFVLPVAGKLPGLGGLNAAMAGRQNVDLVFDDSEARQVFGFQPRSFAPGPADFRLPAVISDHAPHWLGIT